MCIERKHNQFLYMTLYTIQYFIFDQLCYVRTSGVSQGTEKWITKIRFLPLSKKIERKFLTEKENHLQRKPWQIKIHSSKQCETRNSNDKNSVVWIFTSIKTCWSVQKWFEYDGCDLGSSMPKLKALNSPEMPGSSYPSSEPLFGSTFWKSLEVEVSSKKSTREFLASKMVVEVKRSL